MKNWVCGIKYFRTLCKNYICWRFFHWHIFLHLHKDKLIIIHKYYGLNVDGSFADKIADNDNQKSLK